MAEWHGALESVGARVTWSKTFRGRSVLVTGHTGFKGSWLALWLDHLAARVDGYALPPPTNPSNFVTSEIRNLMAHETTRDVRDLAQFQAAVKACQPEVIFHLAAQALVQRSFADPRTTLEINIMGTVNVLETVRNLGRPCVVIVVTSDKCYENSNSCAPHREGDALGGSDPYSASKACTEIVTQAYRKTWFPPEEILHHGVRVASVRAGNAIGGGDWASDRIVPDTVLAMVSKKRVTLRNPDSFRPWQHVLDPLAGYLMLAGRLLTNAEPELCSAWNFGPDADGGATVRELVEELARTWTGVRCENSNDTERLPEERELRLSNDRARTELGWRPRWNFQESVKRTAEWYKSFYADPSRSTRDLCLQDILEYESANSNPWDRSNSGSQEATTSSPGRG
jgi:CDP-glucose 4,6-dehydratase